MAFTWCAVFGLAPFSIRVWAVYIISLPWFLWKPPGTYLVRYLLFPSFLAVHAALSRELASMELLSAFWLMVAYYWYASAHVVHLFPGTKYLKEEQALGVSPAVFFLAWSSGLLLLVVILKSSVPFLLATAAFLLLHVPLWIELARNFSTWIPLILLLVASLVFLVLAVFGTHLAVSLRVGLFVALGIWSLGVPALAFARKNLR